MSSPWGKVETPAVVNLTEIISEEIARDLQQKEERKYAESLKGFVETDPEIPPDLSLNESVCDSDAVIAHMLQLQFDQEHDENVRRTENKMNGTSKIGISFENYLRAPKHSGESDLEEEEIEDIRYRKEFDRFDGLQKQIDSIPACGYKKENGSMVTKHDVTINGRKNARKLLLFPPGFETGDGEDFDLKLSNKVFNSLKRHSQNTEAKRHKVKDKKGDRATAEFGVDEYTRLVLYKLTNQEVIVQVNGIISIGKESVIVQADANVDNPDTSLPPEVVLKIFKTTLSEFKQRDQYIKDDYRFKDRIGKQTAKKTVHLWAEKEMKNLTRLRNAGIPCPDVIALKKHVLVMSFIGTDHIAAPKLKNANMNMADYIIAYDQVVAAMKTMFNVAKVIHADLSEYNILWHEGKCFIIDVSQSVLLEHKNAFYFLRRDCENVTNFFNKKKVPGVVEATELFKIITRYGYEKKVSLGKFKEAKMNPHLVDKPDAERKVHNFDEEWRRSKEAKQHEPPLVEPPVA